MVRIATGSRPTPGRSMPANSGKIVSAIPVGGARKGLSGKSGSADRKHDPKNPNNG